MTDNELNKVGIAEILKIPSKNRQASHVDAIMSLTKEVQFFKKISTEHNTSDIHRECCQVMTLEEYDRGDIIINFGEVGEKFYIILEGNVSVMIPVKKKLKITKNQLEKFKTESLNRSESSGSSDSEEFQVPVQKFKRSETRRAGIDLPGAINLLEIVEKLKDEEGSTTKLQDSLNPFLENEEKALIRLFRDKFNKEKKDILKIIQELDDKFIEIEVDKLEELYRLRDGDSFGELALLSDRPRAASIVTLGRTRVLILRKAQFKNILGINSQKKINAKVKALQQLPYFYSWSKNSLSKIAYYFNTISLKHKQNLFFEGQKPNGIYFIKEGEFMVTKKKDFTKLRSTQNKFTEQGAKIPREKIKLPRLNVELKIVIKGKNESIGGYELLNGLTSYEFSCFCTSNTAEVLVVQKDHFLSRIPNIESIKDKLEEESKRLLERYKSLCESEESKFQKNDSDIRIELNRIEKHTVNTPVPRHHSRNLERSSKLAFSPLSNRGIVINKSSCDTQKPKDSIRKLTEQEIYEAVNGRNSPPKEQPRRHKSFVHKRFPPANFMQKFRINLSSKITF